MHRWCGEKIKILMLAILMIGTFYAEDGSAWASKWMRKRHPAMSVVQSRNWDRSSITESTTNLTIPATLKDSVLILGFISDGVSEGVSITDNGSNTWTQAAAVAVDAGYEYRTQVWYAKASASGTTSLTVNFNTGSGHVFYYYEVSGASLTNPLATPVATNSGFGTTPAPGSVTTTQPAFLVALSAGGDYITAISSPFAIAAQMNGHNAGTRLAPTAGTFTPTFTQGSAQGWASVLVGFQTDPP